MTLEMPEECRPWSKRNCQDIKSGQRKNILFSGWLKMDCSDIFTNTVMVDNIVANSPNAMCDQKFPRRSLLRTTEEWDSLEYGARTEE